MKLINGQPLINGQTYAFEVRAVNAHDAGAAATVTATPALPPSAPLDLTATPGDGEVKLTWDAPESVGGLAIDYYEYRVDRGGDWTSTELNLQVTVTGLANGQTYVFEVRAVNAHDDGEAATVTATPALPPSVPLNLRAAPGDGQVTLTWDAPESDGGLDIERYEVRVDGSGDWTSVGLDLQVTVMDLTNGQLYEFEVRAVNAHDAGAAATVTVTPALPPSAPLNLRAAPDDGEVTLTWEAPESDGGLAIERYEYRVDRGGEWIDTKLVRRVTVKDLTNGRSYTFEVRAVNAHDAGAAATVTMTPAQPPSVPRTLRAVPGNGEVTLSWDVPESDGGAALIGYEYRVGGSGEWTGKDLNPRVTVKNLTNGDSYTFEVRAVNTQGAGEAATVTATPSATPSAPRALRAETGDGEVTLAWDVPLSSGGFALTRYEYRVDGNGEWTGTELNRQVKVTDLANGTSYTFDVRAVNAQGAGEAATMNATPALGPPGTPTDLTASAENSSEIVLHWSAPRGGAAVTGYRIEVSADGGASWNVLVTNTADVPVTNTADVPVTNTANVLVTNTADPSPTYTHTGLHGGTTRHYRVSALTSSGAGMPSNVAHATTRRGPPAAPRNVRATPGDGEVKLAWKTPESDGGSSIERYEYRVDGGGDWTSVGLDLQVTVMDLTNGQLYEFEVRAVNAQGAGPPATVSMTVGRTDRVTGAWLEGFASTVVGHVLAGVQERLARPDSPAARARLAGRTIDGGRAPGPGEAWGWREDPLALSGAMGGEAEEDAGLRTLTGRDVLRDSAFALSGRWPAPGGGLAGVWGSVTYSGVERAGTLSLDGGASTATLGADYGNGRWTAGVAVAHSRGEARYGGSDGRGEVESALTGVYPYAGYTLTGRMSAWVAGGYGLGTLTLTRAGAAAVQADIDLTMAAAGTRHRMLTVAETGGTALALETEGMWLHMANDAAPGLLPSEAGVTRVRLGLEGSHAVKLRGRSTLTPSVAVALRRDGGDAHAGFGAEVGAGVAYAGASGALAVELSGRMLVVHQDSGFRDWGVSGSFVFDRRPGSARGLSLAVRPGFGTSSPHGEGALLDGRTMGPMGREAGVAPDARLEAELAYGWPAFAGRFIGTPHAGLGVSEAGRDHTLGWRLESARRDARPWVELGVAVRRVDRAGAEPEDRVGLGVTLRW